MPQAPHVPDAAIDRLFADADGARWGLTREVFADAVRRGLSKRAPRAPALSEVEGPALSEVEGPALSEVDGPALSEVDGRLTYNAPAPFGP